MRILFVSSRIRTTPVNLALHFHSILIHTCNSFSESWDKQQNINIPVWMLSRAEKSNPVRTHGQAMSSCGYTNTQTNPHTLPGVNVSSVCFSVRLSVNPQSSVRSPRLKRHYPRLRSCCSANRKSESSLWQLYSTVSLPKPVISTPHTHSVLFSPLTPSNYISLYVCVWERQHGLPLCFSPPSAYWTFATVAEGWFNQQGRKRNSMSEEEATKSL